MFYIGRTHVSTRWLSAIPAPVHELLKFTRVLLAYLIKQKTRWGFNCFHWNSNRLLREEPKTSRLGLATAGSYCYWQQRSNLECVEGAVQAFSKGSSLQSLLALPLILPYLAKDLTLVGDWSCHCHFFFWHVAASQLLLTTLEELKPLDFHDFLPSLQNKVEQFTTDGAPDEVLCGELLQKDLPNLKLRCKDSAHASRRLGSIKVWLANWLKWLVGENTLPQCFLCEVNQ